MPLARWGRGFGWIGCAAGETAEPAITPGAAQSDRDRAAAAWLSGEQFHVASFGERNDRGVEGHQADAVAPSEGQELRIGHLPVTGDLRDVAIGERYVIGQEAVAANVTKRREDAASSFNGDEAREHPWVG